MAKELQKKDDRKLYQVMREFWLNGELLKKGQIVKLSDSEAHEWLERGYIVPYNHKG